MGSNWRVENMEGDPDGTANEGNGYEPKSTRSKFFLLDTLRTRLQNSISVGERILENLQRGEDATEDDELEFDKLELSINRFMTQIKEELNSKNLNNEMLAECTEIQMSAEDLLLSLKRKYKSNKSKLEDQRLKSNTVSRLPQLGATTFDGNYLKWYSFWDSFKSTIGDRTDLSAVDKLSYLVELLKGDALDTIQNLEKTHLNYKVAVDLLTERYGKPDMIIEAHYDALNDLKPAANDTKECRKTLNQIEGHLRVLKSLGEDIDHNMFRSTIKRKFPKEMKGDLWLRLKSKGYTVATLRETLGEIISANEEEMKQLSCHQTTESSFTTDTLLSTTTSENAQTHSHPSRKRPLLSTDQSSSTTRWSRGNRTSHKESSTPVEPPTKQQRLENSAPNNQPKSRRSCIFCGGNHFHEDCPKVSAVDDRLASLRKGGRCFVCLRVGHLSSQCAIKSTKLCPHCNKTGHNRCICKERIQKPIETTAAFSQSHGDTILQTAVINVSNEDHDHQMTARTLFDTGSQKSYVTSEVAHILNLRTIEETSLTVYTFGRLEPKMIQSRLVSVHIDIPIGGSIEILAYVVPNITGLIPAFPDIKQDVKQLHPQLQVAEDTDTHCKADVLIGNDHYHSFITGNSLQISERLYLIESRIGWILSGSTRSSQEQDDLSVLTFVQGGRSGHINQSFTFPDPPLQEDNIKVIWELETIGIKDSPKVLDQDGIIKFFNETTVFQDKRYQVKWPWIEYPIDLPINYGMAFGRLGGLIKRSDKKTLELYNEVLQDQLSKGIIEEVHEKKLPTTHAVHYLPHHCVVQNNKTTKLRVVYDASAKSKGHCSLNEYLYKGPLMLEDLVSLLLRFRTNPIGITADIEKAFLQVGLQLQDRDVTRFLWLKDIAKPVTEDNVIHLRFCRVPFGIISSPYLLAATIRYHLGKKRRYETDKISTSLYVDNLVTGVNSTEDGITLYDAAVSAFNELSMNLRDWTTNSRELWQKIPNEHRTDFNQVATVLGLKWDTTNDTLRLAVDPSVLVKPITSKREVLRLVASIYDPCGFVAPLLLPARVFLQSLWKKGYKWDTALDETELQEWNRCVQPLRHIADFEIPRYYHHDELKTLSSLPDQKDVRTQLHCFTDASQLAYSAILYIRRTTTHSTSVNMIMSRTRLCPVKDRERMTIPKLELLGVTIGTRLLTYAKATLQLNIDQTYIWTDSQIVLSWMKSEKLLAPFVSRRISEIKSVPLIQFRYINSIDNPADIATREQFTSLPPVWQSGPTFLSKHEASWPCESSAWGGLGETSLLRGTDQNALHHDSTSTLLSQIPEEHQPNDPLLEDEHYDIPSEKAQDPVPSSQLATIKRIQLEHYPKEVHGQATHLTRTLGLFKDEQGILRCRGRLQNAVLPLDQKYPILLPKATQFTSDLIMKLHEDNKHVGASHTLSLLRKRFWVPQGRSQVNQALKRCKICIKHGGGPYKLPPMPPLPPERVNLCRPFLYTGLDYLGPLTVVQDSVTEKRWCCIFTCMASRAIRLEVINNLSAEEFLLCLRRFVAAQGVPALIVSDNAAQFKLAADVLQAPICTDSNLSWHFIPELSPWQGGFYERLVGIVKHCLRRSLDKILLNDSQLMTVLKEIETVINSRPLTTVGHELEHVLSPSDFLSACGTHPLPLPADSSQTNITATRSNLVDGWKKGQRALEEFKTVFQDQYLTSLRERPAGPHDQPRILTKQQPKVGAIVQVWDEKQKTSNRGHWKIGKIKTLTHGRDGLIRTAQVELESGVTVNRSIAHLYPLELEDSDEEHSTNIPDNPPDDGSSPLPPQDRHVTPPRDSEDPEKPRGSDKPDSPCPSDSNTQSQSPHPTTPPSGTKSRPHRRSFKNALQVIRRWTHSLVAHSLVGNSLNTDQPQLT